MNLYLISQNVNHHYDTYDSAVVTAETAEDARDIHPDGNKNPDHHCSGSWADRGDIKVVLIGTATLDVDSGSVVCASFRAG